MGPAVHSNESEHPAQITVADPDAELSQIMRNHEALLDSLRGVAGLVEDLEDRDDSVRRVLATLPGLSTQTERDALSLALRVIGAALAGKDPDSEDGEEDPSEESELVAVERVRDEAGAVIRTSVSFADSEIADLMTLVLLDASTFVSEPNRKDLVRASLLTMVVGSFDALTRDLAAAYFRAHPGALGDAKEFSLADLAGLATLADAREQLIRRRADELELGFDELAKWFKDRMRIDLSRLVIDWDRFYEISQRRHLIVHTGGRISDRYLEKVRTVKSKAGGLLSVDADYLAAALDEFLAVGVNLTFAVWFSLTHSPETPGGYLLAATRRAARNGRWEVVRSHCGVARKLKGPESLCLDFQALDWLAAKAVDGLDSVEQEVHGWDTSALRLRWQLVKLSLLDELDDAADLAVGLLQDGQLSGVTVLTDPLFAGLREHPKAVAAIQAKGVVETE